MPSELTISVRQALLSYLNNRTSQYDDIAVDVLRIIQEESTLLLEKQYICDAFDKDPFQLKGNGGKDMDLIISRVKSILSVTSCDRCTTKEGYSSVNAVVKLETSDNHKLNSKEVQNSVSLTFSFERKPFIHPGVEEEEETANDDNSTKAKKHSNSYEEKGTQIKYTIDLSRDYDKKERLLIIEVIASGEAPSVDKAIPMMDEGDMDDNGDDDEWEEFDDNNDENGAESGDNDDDDEHSSSAMNGNEIQSKQNNSSKSKSPPSSQDLHPKKRSKQNDHDEEKSTTEMSVKSCNTSKTALSAPSLNDGKDRFAAYVDPDVLYNFINWTQLDSNNCFDGPEVIYFLMTFPFYEHEWDLVGFLLEAVFGMDDDDDEDDDEEEEEDDE
mmetsp:Transcript_16605/g.24388  ORF Transcript_16605/g.24388 Transcript_16605/m.24388 type:complete len:384 (+) Transcript_16605:171-1322(+)